MNYPSTALTILEALYQHGINTCLEIEKFQPNVVIGLAHSGWMPVVVAQTLWAHTRQGPFPPAMRTNLGREKHEFYAARFGASIPTFCCWECSGSPDRVGHYLAWVAEQQTWLATLRMQIEQVYSGIPARILVVDDVFGGARSAYTVMALLHTLYPKVETYIMAGHTDLTDHFVTAWLEEFVPGLVQKKDEKPGRFTRYSDPLQKLLKPLITGTEDITPDRLDWQLLSPESPAARALIEDLPLETILAAPAWARELACAYALERLRGEFRGDIPSLLEDQDHFSPVRRLSLSPDERLMARAWQRGEVTRVDIGEIFGDSLSGIKKGLKAVFIEDDWHRRGRRKAGLYVPVLAVESWITAYDPHRAELTDPGKAVYCFAEFLPGQLWAGAYPMASDIRVKDQPHQDLLSFGIDLYLSLTDTEDVTHKWPYEQALRQTCQQSGKKASLQTFPLPFRAGPTLAEMALLLKKITRALKGGHRIYLHAGHNLDGRAPLVLACLLIQQGQSLDQAVARVNSFWLETLPFLIRLPLTGPQQMFIAEWAEHCALDAKNKLKAAGQYG
jgi:hypothetical protein